MMKLKIGKLIRIISASAMGIVTFVLMLKLGILLEIPYLKTVWGIPLVLSLILIMSENIKIWNEQESKAISL